MLVAGRFLLSSAYSPNTGGEYFWEHTYWLETTDFPNLAQLNLAVVADMGLLYTNQVKKRGNRVYNAATGALLLSNNFGAGTACNLAARPNTTLTTVARWRLVGSDESKSYHLHRALIGSDDLENGSWSAAGLLRQITHCNTFVGQGIYRTKTGALITTSQIGSFPIGWQLRHGTRRRNSRFWV